jgi:hypothetical protein
MPSKGPNAATTASIDLEHGDRDRITPSGSSSLTPDGPRSKAATPRPSLEIEEVVPRHRARHTQRIWMRLEAKLPAPVRKCGRQTVAWLEGPKPPRKHCIKPFFECVQTFPARLPGRLPAWARLIIYIVLFVIWAVIFGVILTNYSLPSNIGGFGAPARLSCVTNLWYVYEHYVLEVCLISRQVKPPVLRPRWSQLPALRELVLFIQLPGRLPQRTSSESTSHRQCFYKLQITSRGRCNG